MRFRSSAALTVLCVHASYDCVQWNAARLPLSSIVLALLLTGGSAGVAPLIIVGVAVAYLTTLALTERTRRHSPGIEQHHDVGDPAPPGNPA